MTTPQSTANGQRAKRRRGAYRRQLTAPQHAGSGAPTVSPDARKMAAVILEVLAGVRTPTSAAQALGVGPPRYYLVEQRAIQGLVAACEPRAKGRTPTADRQVRRLERELVVCRRELARQQALARAAQRALGLSAPPVATAPGKQSAGSKRKRQRKPSVRALRAARALRASAADPDSSGPGTATAVKPQIQSVGEGNRPAEADSSRSVPSGMPGG